MNLYISVNVIPIFHRVYQVLPGKIRAIYLEGGLYSQVEMMRRSIVKDNCKEHNLVEYKDKKHYYLVEKNRDNLMNFQIE